MQGGTGGWVIREGASAVYEGRTGVVTMNPDSDYEVKLRWPDGETSSYINVRRLTQPQPGTAVVAVTGPLATGDRVRVRNVSVTEARQLQEQHGGWSESMTSLLGREGTVSSVDDDGDVNVHGKCWNPALLERVDAVDAPAGATGGATGGGGGGHRGEWRGSSMRQWCKRSADQDGAYACTHSGGIISSEHWSCCGATTRSAAGCGENPAPTATRTSGARVTSEFQNRTGVRVRRGADWEWGDQDHSGTGEIVAGETSDGWVKVRWEHGSVNSYRCGSGGNYDLSLA
jgi:hypothetical protein